MAPSYCNPTAFKTDASPEKLLRLADELFGEATGDRQFDATVNPDAKKMLKDKVPRFLPNPEKNWGPKSASKIKLTVDRSVVKTRDEKDGSNGSGVSKRIRKGE